uniref:Uncharacterized protein n=1 Tax=Oryza barthii TaxID=65489 RepID=A0A0D3FME4_9ORYZ
MMRREQENAGATSASRMEIGAGGRRRRRESSTAAGDETGWIGEAEVDCAALCCRSGRLPMGHIICTGP